MKIVIDTPNSPGTQFNETTDEYIYEMYRYLENKKVEVVVASNTPISEKMAKKYENEEQKDPILIDYEELERIGVELIEDDLVIVDKDNTLKHNSLKLSSIIFSYLMR